MARISFAKDLTAALKGAGSAVVVGAHRTFGGKSIPRLFSPKAQRLLAELANQTKPGVNGQLATTLTGTNPARITLGVIPDGGSRYTAPARPDALFKVLSGANLGSGKKHAVLFVLADDAHLLPSLGQLARALPQYHRGTRRPSPRISVLFIGTDGQPVKLAAREKEYFKAVHEAARLVDSPPSDMHPGALADATVELLEGVAGVELTSFVGEGLVEAGLGGIYSVGKAASNPPRMVVATYTPAEPSGTHVALIGKGVTFDTGGLHLKPRGSMETMKCDMGGSAAVLGAFYALAKAKRTNHKVSLLMCLAENAIGPGSYKPDDIVTMHSGHTVEINNTDAEGRLLLGDGVSYAARVLEADVVIDAATLTGAQMIATGANHAGIVSNDAELERLTVEAGFDSGDLVHPLPFAPEFYAAEFKSQIADMKNSVKNRANAQSSCAAQFVYNHIDDTKVRWLHVDLAGPSFRNERGTGYGVGLLSNLIERL